ncbi:hypothetical protein [Enterococcus italicus]|uniref:hypothetical protein n=1 Tax=Enterococcus italicus TaxID=246144 RepID=UPI0009002488|nr:hypothetical protein [Enterococcus italicus]OJG58004.1 hypothetical protein RT43_GL000922 [Enterococcus italicus DSM 15952]
MKKLLITATILTGMVFGGITAKADTLDTVADVANQTKQVVEDTKDNVDKDGLIETIDKNRGNIEELVDKGGEFAYSFGNNLDDAFNYNKETNNKNIFTKTSNFISILFTEKTKEQALDEEKQELSIVDTAKEEVANNDLQSSAKQALSYQFGNGGFSNIPEGFAGFLAVGIRTLLGIIIITTIAIAIRVNKSSKDKEYAKYQKQLSRLR